MSTRSRGVICIKLPEIKGDNNLLKIYNLYETNPKLAYHSLVSLRNRKEIDINLYLLIRFHFYILNKLRTIDWDRDNLYIDFDEDNHVYNFEFDCWKFYEEYPDVKLILKLVSLLDDCLETKFNDNFKTKMGYKLYDDIKYKMIVVDDYGYVEERGNFYDLYTKVIIENPYSN